MVLAGVANKHPFRNPAEDRAAIISSLRAIFDGSMRSVAKSGGLYRTQTAAGIYQVLYWIPFREGLNVFQRTDQKGELFYPLQNRLQHSSSNFQEKK
jgi:hypothetical protein